jgi:uncharacterized protein (DUF1499 family)
MKKMIFWIAIPSVGLVCFLGILSIISRRKPAVGLVAGRLRPCSARPNCVCSEDKNLPSYVDPLAVIGSPESDWEKAKRIISEMRGKIQLEDDCYLWATFSTSIFRFIDDLELRMDKKNGVIHIRSGSRVGYSDMGANRRRVERLRARFSQSKSSSR